MNKKGFVLVTSYMIVSVLLIIGIAFVMQSFNERKALTRDIESLKALNLAEAGIDDSFFNLKSTTSFEGNTFCSSETGLGEGCTVSVVWPTNIFPKLITSTGYIPNYISPRAQRTLYATAIQSDLHNFFDNAMYVAGNINVSGGANMIGNAGVSGTGNVRSGGTIASNLVVASGSGSKISDSSINPLARLDFETLKARSMAQGYYNVAPSQFPTTDFYYMGNEPNIIYLEHDLQLSGSTTVYGLFVVAGEVITNPDYFADASITGNVKIHGCIYSRGTVTVGGTSEIDGGVWAGTAVLNGNIDIDRNIGYMNSLNASSYVHAATPQITAWRDKQYPFN